MTYSHCLSLANISEFHFGLLKANSDVSMKRVGLSLEKTHLKTKRPGGCSLYLLGL
jgi:hypothetical protein